MNIYQLLRATGREPRDCPAYWDIVVAFLFPNDHDYFHFIVTMAVAQRREILGFDPIVASLSSCELKVFIGGMRRANSKYRLAT